MFCLQRSIFSTMIFPREDKNIDMRLAGVASILTTQAKSTIVPMIMSDIFRALTSCKVGAMFFEDCNILLQMWLVEHRNHCLRYINCIVDKGSCIEEYEKKVSDYNFSESTEAWTTSLRSMSTSQIEWTLSWISTSEVIHMFATGGYFLLMGLWSIPPMHRQLGRYQGSSWGGLECSCGQMHPKASFPESLVRQIWSEY